jgi:hypothetical protein
MLIGGSHTPHGMQLRQQKQTSTMQQPQQLQGLAQAQQHPRQQMQSTLQHRQRIPEGRRRRQRRRQHSLDATAPCVGCARARSAQRVRKPADACSGGEGPQPPGRIRCADARA